MGTRGHVRFKDEENNILATLYCQEDSYPSGLGDDLKKILAGITQVNGLQAFPPIKKWTHFNGPDELPILTIVRLKENQRARKMDLYQKMRQARKEEELAGNRVCIKPSHYRPTPGGFEPGSYYLMPVHSDDDGIDYAYTVRTQGVGKEPWIAAHRVHDDKLLWSGTISDFDGKKIEEENDDGS